MKIVIAPHAFDPVDGGAERLIKRVAQGLEANGHEVTVLTTDVSAVQGYYRYGHRTLPAGEQTVAGLRVIRVRYTGVLYRLFSQIERIRFFRRLIGQRMKSGLLSFYVWRLGRRYRRRLKALSPDVVIVLPHLIINVLAVLTARESLPFSCVMVPMLHEHDEQWSNEVMQQKLTKVDHIVAMTAHEQRVLQADYGVHADQITLGSTGIDCPEEISESKGHDRVVFVGRLVASKGIAELIDAMVLLWQSGIVSELVLAGQPSDETRIICHKIRELSPEYQQNIRVLESIGESEKHKVLASARCLVLPSRIESLGLVLLEAWSVKTPVITWNLPLFESIIDRDKDGLLAANSVEDLSACIRQLLENPDMAVKMGQSGYQKVRSRYTWPQTISAYERACDHAVTHFQSQAANLETGTTHQ